MRVSTVLSGLALLAAAAITQAHAHLQKSTPADGSIITASPPTVVLRFSEAARLTVAWIQKADGVKQKLSSLPQKAATEISVSLPALAPGSYVLSWRALSDDGHVMPGQIHFTLSAGVAADHRGAH